MEYVRGLSTQLGPSRLSALQPPANLLIIGHGSPSLIASYVTQTSCAFPIYADPTRAVHGALDFRSSLALGATKPAYITQSFVGGLVSSFWGEVTAGRNMLAGGKFGQNGGEAVWDAGELVYLRRMANTRDHLEVEDLVAVLERSEGAAVSAE